MYYFVHWLSKKKHNYFFSLFNSTPPISPAVAGMVHYILYLYHLSSPIYFHFECVLSFIITTRSLLQTSFTFRRHFRLCCGYFSFVFGLDLDLKTRFKIDSFFPQFLAISRPALDLNFELGWFITWIISWILQKPFIMVIPTRSMKLMTIAHLTLWVRLWCWDGCWVGCWWWKNRNVGWVSLKRRRNLRNLVFIKNWRPLLFFFLQFIS